jgi:hypothetical protein
MRSRILRVLSACRYVLPAVHLCACLVIANADIVSGWEQMTKGRLPVFYRLVGIDVCEGLALALVWSFGNALVVFLALVLLVHPDELSAVTAF